MKEDDGGRSKRFLALFLMIGFVIVLWKALGVVLHKVPVVGQMAYLAS